MEPTLCDASWRGHLRRAWREFCREHGDQTIDPTNFIATAQAISVQCPSGRADVFGQIQSKAHADEVPDRAAILQYLAHVVSKQSAPLGLLLDSARASHTGGRAANFSMLARCFSFLLRSRFMAFCDRLAALPPRWTWLRSHRLENVDRLLDSTTWEFIEVYRTFAAAHRQRASWSDVLGWLLQNSFTCVAKPFADLSAFWQCSSDTVFNTTAYNHQCGNYASLQALLNSGAEKSAVGGRFLKALVTSDVDDAVAAGLELQSVLLSICGLGHFNTTEALWHCVLLREAFLYVSGAARQSQRAARLRKQLFASPDLLYGPGGLNGLTLFFPAVAGTTVGSCAAELREYLQDRHSLVFEQAHGLQWGLCMFSKGCNTAYNRRFDDTSVDSFRDAQFYAEWHRRLTTYPLGIRYFQDLARTMDAVEEFEAFLSRAAKLARLVERHEIEPDCVCRACWHECGVGIPINNRRGHGFYNCNKKKR